MAKIFKMLKGSLFVMLLVSCSAMVQDFGKLTKEVECRVEHYFESPDTNDYILDEERTVNLKTKDISSIIKPLVLTGFTYEKTDETKVDNVYVYKLYYKRNTVTITFETNNGGWDKDELDKNPKFANGKFGQKFKTPFKEEMLYRARHTFTGWDKHFETFPAEDQTITATWEIKDFSNYKVNYYVQNILDDDFTFEYSETFAGESESYTNFYPASREGFDILDFNQKIIKTDDSTIIDIKYIRHCYKFTFVLSDSEEIKLSCKWNDNTSENKVTKVYKYESIFNPEEYAFLTEDPTRGDADSGWGFAGWNKECGSLPSIVTKDQIFIAQWAKPYAKYKVTMQKEKITEPGTYEESYKMYNGTVGKMTDFVPPVVTGYTVEPVEQKIIAEDDSTELIIKYNLANVTITFNPDNGYWNNTENDVGLKVEHGKYGQPLQFTETPSKPLNKFKGWITSANSTPVTDGNFTFDAVNTTYYAKWERDGAWYTVDYYLQNLNDDEYVLVEDRSISESGKVGATTNVSIELPGYEYREPVVQQIIKEDDSTVVEVYLKRKIFNATFKTDGGKWNNNSKEDIQLSGKFESKFQNPGTVTKDFYIFDGWDPELPETFTADGTYTAKWKFKGAEYSIKYLFENLTYDTEEEKYSEYPEILESKNIQGYDGTKVTVEAPSVPGFTAVTPVETELSPSGNTIIEVKYNRNTVTYTFDANGGKWTDGENKKEFKQKYGSTLTVAAPEKDMYAFAGWTPEFNGTVSETDQTYKANWVNNGAEYTIEYYLQNITDDDYTKADEYTKKVIGEIDSTTNVTASLKGFTVKSVDQQVIKADGTTVVKVYLDRNLYTIIYNPEGGKWADSSTESKSKEYRYGATIEKPLSVTKADYKLKGWEPEIPADDAFICENNAEYKAVWEYSGTEYKINYRFEKLEWTDENDKYEIDRRLLTDKVDHAPVSVPVTVEAPAVTGFIAQPVAPVTLNEDGSTVITVYYDRISGIKYIFDANGGSWEDENLITRQGKFGAEVGTIADPVRPLYKFKGWAVDDSNVTVNIDETYGVESKIYKAVWYKYAANYTVVYKFQNIEDNEYTKDDSFTKIEEGEIDRTTEYSAPSVPGFKCVSVEQALIKADGSAVVNVKYDRNIYTIKLDPNGGRWNSDSAKTTKEYTGRYGQKFELDDSVSYPDYKFLGWDQNLPGEFTEGLAEVYKAIWEQVGTKYKVEHYEENLTYESDNDKWYLFKSEEFTGSVTVAVKPTPEKHTGFIARAVDETTIKEDGSTVIKIYYDRISRITYTFNPGDGHFAGEEDGSRTGKYGAPVEVPANPIRQFYTFKGWTTSKTQTVEDVDATFGDIDKLYEAVWEELPTTEISGLPVYTGGEIVLEATSESKTLSVKVTVPYNGEWQFQWYDNDSVMEGITPVFVENVGSFTKSNMSKGRHKITVYAKDANGMVKSAFVTVVIE